MLSELSPVPGTALPIEAFRDHLRLGRGFADEALQDGVLETALRAAIALVEGRAQAALLIRTFRQSVTGWADPEVQPLARRPVVSVDAVRLVGAQGAILIDPARWALRGDVVVASAGFPSLGPEMSAEFEFTAGFSADWAGVPADLRQAVFLQAAAYYGARDGAVGAVPGLEALIAPYRPVRIGLGNVRGHVRGAVQ